VADHAPSLRARLFAILRPNDASQGARRWRRFHLAVLAAGLLAVALGTVETLPPAVHFALIGIIVAVSAIFLVEYAVRLWVAPEAPTAVPLSPASARLRWAGSLQGLIALTAVVPALSVISNQAWLGGDAAGVFCLLWILKLVLHAPAMGTLGRVVSNERATLASIFVVFFIVLIGAATATHLLEQASQPDKFGTLPDALWWAVVTLTTTGYGDVVPMTAGGKMIGALVMVSGIAVLALMTGVLASSFAEEEKRREYIRVWEQVVRVPMFAALGVVTLSEIVGKLRTRYYPSRIAIVRRGDEGDAMFFISAGEVEVRLPDAAIKLEQGAFFGEMALLDRRPRNATVTTTKPTTVLVLYASDFYQIASKVPALADAVEAEAQRRQAENAGRLAKAN
jgi:voltage-gated potassium channel